MMNSRFQDQLMLADEFEQTFNYEIADPNFEENEVADMDTCKVDENDKEEPEFPEDDEAITHALSVGEAQKNFANMKLQQTYADAKTYVELLNLGMTFEMENQRQLLESHRLYDVHVVLEYGIDDGPITADFELPPDRPQISQIARSWQRIEFVDSESHDEVLAAARIIFPPKGIRGRVKCRLIKETVRKDFLNDPNNSGSGNRLCDIVWNFDDSILNRVRKCLEWIKRLIEGGKLGNDPREYKDNIPMSVKDPRAPQLSPEIVQTLLKVECRTQNKADFKPNPYNAIGKSLYKEQIDAINIVMNNPISLIQGPPGCGKTHVLSHAIDHIMSMPGGMRILVSGTSNVATDNILARVSEKYPDDCIRLSSLANEFGGPELLQKFTHSKRRLEQKNLDVICTFAKLKAVLNIPKNQQTRNDRKTITKLLWKYERDLLKAYRIVFATNVGCGDRRFRGNFFDFVLIDEAGQNVEALTLLPILRTKCNGRIALFGDHKQLGPIIASSSAKNMNFSYTFFERLYESELFTAKIMLCEQYRMHIFISQLVSYLTYENENGEGVPLKNGVSAGQRQPKNLHNFWPDPQKPVAFIHTTMEERKIGYSFENEEECNIIVNVIGNLIIAYAMSGSDITVISSYGAQTRRLDTTMLDIKNGDDEEYSDYERKNFGLVTVVTVDGFQGKENEIIIFSIVRSNYEGLIGFLANQRRLNVAISRAKCGLIIVGNATMFNGDNSKTWMELVEWCQQHGVVHDGYTCLGGFGPAINPGNTPEPVIFRKDTLEVTEQQEYRSRLPVMPTTSIVYPFKNITVVANNKNAVDIEISVEYIGKIQGVGGSVVNRICTNNNIKMLIPNPELRKGDSVICTMYSGSTPARFAALREIDGIIDSDIQIRENLRKDYDNDDREPECGQLHDYNDPDILTQAFLIITRHQLFLHANIRHDCRGYLLTKDEWVKTVQTKHNIVIMIPRAKGEFSCVWVYAESGTPLNHEFVIQLIQERIKAGIAERKQQQSTKKQAMRQKQTF